MRAADLSFLFKLSTLVYPTLSIREILENTIFYLTDYLDAEVGFFALVDENGDFKIEASRGLTEKERKEIVKKEEIIAVPFLTGERIKMMNLTDISSPLSQMLKDIGIQSFYADLIKIGEKEVGIIFLGRTYNAPFTLANERIIKTVTSLLALVLENARMHEFLKNEEIILKEKVKERTAELEKAYEELKTLDKLKARFVQDTAHELKTPLSVIITSLELLKRTKPTEKEKQKKLMEFLTRNAERLRNIIENVLEVYKVEAGREYKKEKLNLREITEIILKNFYVLAEEKGLAIETDMEDATVMADKKALQTVVENLVENAIKFTQKGKIIVKLKKKENEAIFSVEDTGIGMKKEDQKYLFTRFYKVSVDYPGAGVGLSLCKDILEAHGGKITFKSEYGKGTTVTFTLPLYKD